VSHQLTQPEIVIKESRVTGMLYAECPTTDRTAIIFQFDNETFCYRFGDTELKSYSSDEIERWLRGHDDA
jgi:hypothetical protein